MKTMQELIEKSKKEWGETWDEGMIEYDADYNEYIVWVGKADIYKTFFDFLDEYRIELLCSPNGCKQVL